MIPTFRKSLLEVEDINYGKDPNEENPLYQLKMIFGGLMEVEKQYFNPKGLCHAFKDIDGSPMDPTVQRDVDEFLLMLMDRLENLIKGKKEEKIIKNLF
jgi:hypothetical protein